MLGNPALLDLVASDAAPERTRIGVGQLKATAGPTSTA
jgi:hypothetical protein